MTEIFMNIGATAFAVFLVYTINRVYTVLSELKG